MASITSTQSGRLRRLARVLRVEQAQLTRWFQQPNVSMLWHRGIGEVQAALRVDSPVYAPPERWGEHVYWTATGEGGRLLHCRATLRPGRAPTGNALPPGSHTLPSVLGDSAPISGHRLILDEAKLAAETGYARVATIRVSPGSGWLGVCYDTVGDDRLKGLVTRAAGAVGKQPGDVLHLRNAHNIAWGAASAPPVPHSNDGALLEQGRPPLFYTSIDRLQRANSVWHIPAPSAWEQLPAAQRPGPGVARPLLLRYDSNPNVFLDVSSTKDGQWITINANSRADSEVWLLPADWVPDKSQLDQLNAASSLHLVAPRQPGVQYYVEHWHGWAVAVTNEGGAQNYEVRAVPMACAAQAGKGKSGRPLREWQVLVPHRADTVIEDMDMFEWGIALYVRDCSSTVPRVELIQLTAEGEDPCQLGAALRASGPLPADIPGTPLEVQGAANLDAAAQGVRVHLTHGHKLEATAEISRHGQCRVLAEEPTGAVPGWGNAHELLCTQRISVPGPDGESLPVTIVRRKDTPLAWCSPLLVQVYGAYGTPLDASWDVARLPMLLRGWTLAWAHVRGGGEKGPRWAEAARGAQRATAIADTVAVIEALHAAGYGAPAFTALRAESAGGVAAGSVAIQRPDLIRACVLSSAFLDVKAAMSNSDAALTAPERVEWGDPVASPEIAAAMEHFCPQSQLKRLLARVRKSPGEFSHPPLPHLMLSASVTDPVVPAEHSVRFGRTARAVQENWERWSNAAQFAASAGLRWPPRAATFGARVIAGTPVPGVYDPPVAGTAGTGHPPWWRAALAAGRATSMAERYLASWFGGTCDLPAADAVTHAIQGRPAVLTDIANSGRGHTGHDTWDKHVEQVMTELAFLHTAMNLPMR